MTFNVERETPLNVSGREVWKDFVTRVVPQWVRRCFRRLGDDRSHRTGVGRKAGTKRHCDYETSPDRKVVCIQTIPRKRYNQEELRKLHMRVGESQRFRISGTIQEIKFFRILCFNYKCTIFFSLSCLFDFSFGLRGHQGRGVRMTSLLSEKLGIFGKLIRR